MSYSCNCNPESESPVKNKLDSPINKNDYSNKSVNVIINVPDEFDYDLSVITGGNNQTNLIFTLC